MLLFLNPNTHTQLWGQGEGSELSIHQNKTPLPRALPQSSSKIHTKKILRNEPRTKNANVSWQHLRICYSFQNEYWLNMILLFKPDIGNYMWLSRNQIFLFGYRNSLSFGVNCKSSEDTDEPSTFPEIALRVAFWEKWLSDFLLPS